MATKKQKFEDEASIGEEVESVVDVIQWLFFGTEDDQSKMM